VELNGAGTPAEVLSVRTLGATALIELRGAEAGPHLRVRLPADRVPRTGERVGLAMKTAQALVFPRQA